MPSQKIIYTVLPKGIQNNRLRVSVFISPRLTPDVPNGVLGTFQTFWNPAKGSWPGYINDRGFELEFRMGGPSVMAGTSFDGQHKPDTKLWETVFKATTTVRGFQFRDLSTRFIHSYPVRSVVGYVRDLYKSCAETTPMEFPRLRPRKDDSPAATLQDLIDRIGSIANSERWQRQPWNPVNLIKDQRQRALNADMFKKYGFNSREELAFAQVNRFYDRPHKNNPYRERPDPALAGVRKRLAPPKPDFHEMLASLGDYPALMRLLGMVIDLEVTIPPGHTAASLAGADAVRVKTGGASEYSPWTKLIKDFVAKPRGADIADGMLSVDNKDLYDLVQVDTDSVGLKTLNFAGSMLRIADGSNAGRITTSVLGDQQSLPSVRTSGLAIAKYNRAFRLAEHLFNVAQLDSAQAGNVPAEVFAEDLVRGYRVDAWDKSTGRWHSLTARIGHFVFTEGTHPDLDLAEEGYVKGGSTTSTNEGLPTDQELYLHENMFQWDGWSLTASRPGRTIVAKSYDEGGNPLPHQDEMVEKPQNKAVTELKMEVASRPQPGTLPRLRFGREYRLRARVVDLAGNSVPLEKPDSWDTADRTFVSLPPKDHATQPLLYGRFEPVSSPVVMPRTPFGEGESAERMVIRSNFDVSAVAYGEQEYVKNALAGKWYTYAGVNERHFAPPKTSQLTAETHGQFDDAIGKGNAHQAAYNVSLKEAGSFMDTAIVDTSTGAATIPVTGVKIVTPPQTAKPHAVLPGTPAGPGQYVLKPGDSMAAGQYILHDSDKLLLPYLPDPFSRGTALRGLPGVNAAGAITGGLKKVKPLATLDAVALLVPHGDSWPDYQPFRLQMVEGTGEPEWKESERLLVVPVPKGRVAKVHYSSYIGKDPKTGRRDYELMGLSQWANDPVNTIARYAEAGMHWMVTPHRTIELAHVVQQPLKEAEFYKSAVMKWKIGDTYVDIYGFIDLDAPSTGKVEVLAEWFDPVDSVNPDTMPDDDPGTSGSERFNRRSDVFALNIDEDAPDRLVIHCKDVDGIWLSQAGLKDYKGVKLPAVQDGSAAKLAASEEGKAGKVVVAEVDAGKLAGKDLVFKADKNIKVLEGVLKTDGGDEISPAYAPRCRHEFNDTKHRFVDYRIVGTTRYREYFPLEIVKNPKNITRTGPIWKQVNILSSARPDAPKVLYVVPTFGWEEKKIGTQIISRRCGNGLRVYLDRPWYSSGIGELLGVVLRDPPSGGGLLAPAAATNDPLKPFVTDVGMDPIWGSEYTKSTLRISDFPLATHGQTGLTLDELGGVKVSVAGHPVDFDKERKLWYCDIEIDAGDSYFPFVRLALARYQPDSIPNAHLSRVVMADFAQLAPDRVAAVVFDTKDDKKINVLVSGIYGVGHLVYSGNPGVQLNQYRFGSTNSPEILPGQGMSRVLQVAIETKIGSGGPDSPWVPMPDPAKSSTVLVPVQKVDEKMIWGGQLTFPEPPGKPGSRPYRIIITEAEVLPVDGPGMPLGGGTLLARSMRIVYADTIELQ